MSSSLCREGFRSSVPTEAHEQWQHWMESKAWIPLLQQKTSGVTTTVQLTQKNQITSILWLEGRKSDRDEVPNQGPAGPGAGHHLQGGVIADFGRGAERPRLQDVLHQAPVAADDVQGLHHKLLGLIWGAKREKFLLQQHSRNRKSFCRNSRLWVLLSLLLAGENVN